MLLFADATAQPVRNFGYLTIIQFPADITKVAASITSRWTCNRWWGVMIVRKVNDLSGERNVRTMRGGLRSHQRTPDLTTLHAELTELLDGAAQLANWLRSASDDGAVPIDVERTVQETSDAISEKCDKICLRMTTMQAHSIVELKFKIAAFAYLCPEDQEPHIELARSICDDIGQLQV